MTTSISTINLSINDNDSLNNAKLQNSDDQFREYRDLCEIRLRRLERYKKAKSFCSLDSDDSLNFGNIDRIIEKTSIHSFIASSSSSASTTTATLSSNASTVSTNQRPISNVGNNVFESQVEQLKQKMISMMETDVELLQKLVALGETIQGLKSTKERDKTYSRCLQRTSSENSINSSYDEEDDEWRPLDSRDTFSQSTSAITRLYVDNNRQKTDDDEDDDELSPNVQYFSRKNSVLRIPIPPRSSNRFLGTHKIPKRPSMMRKNCIPRLLSSEDSGNSSGSDTSPQQHSPINDGTSTLSSEASLYDVQETIEITRRSNASVDSGISGSFVTTIKTE